MINTAQLNISVAELAQYTTENGRQWLKHGSLGIVQCLSGFGFRVLPANEAATNGKSVCQLGGYQFLAII